MTHLNLITSQRPHLQTPSHWRWGKGFSVWILEGHTHLEQTRSCQPIFFLKLQSFLNGALDGISTKQIRNMYRYVLKSIYCIQINVVIHILPVRHDYSIWPFGHKATFMQSWSWRIRCSFALGPVILLPTFFLHSFPSFPVQTLS